MSKGKPPIFYRTFYSTLTIDQVANPELTDNSFQNRARGFAAGMASGITKLAVGHPFGKTTLIAHLFQLIIV